MTTAVLPWKQWVRRTALDWLFVVRTLAGALLALAIALRLDLSSPGSAAVTVAIIALPQTGMVLEKSFYRFLGTLLGAIVTLCLVAVLAQHQYAFIAAVGSFTPKMIELDPVLCRDIAARGRIVLDTAQARHEAGDLLQAGIDPEPLPTLAELVQGRPLEGGGPVLFKSCGWAGWDLAAARYALQAQPA